MDPSRPRRDRDRRIDARARGLGFTGLGLAGCDSRYGNIGIGMDGLTYERLRDLTSECLDTRGINTLTIRPGKPIAGVLLKCFILE